jgi:amino-acid N-acetyltransferase
MLLKRVVTRGPSTAEIACRCKSTPAARRGTAVLTRGGGGGRPPAPPVRRRAVGVPAASTQEAATQRRRLFSSSSSRDPPRDDPQSQPYLARSPTMMHGVQVDDGDRAEQRQARKADQRKARGKGSHEHRKKQTTKSASSPRTPHLAEDKPVDEDTTFMDLHFNVPETDYAEHRPRRDDVGDNATEPDAYRFEDVDVTDRPLCPDVDGFILTETQNIVLRAPLLHADRPPRVQEVKDTFRSMAPYIATHRGNTVVIHVPGEAIDGQCANFPALVQDIILMQTLGIKIVLVAGCRPQINERMIAAGRDPLSMLDEHGMRRTDAFTLRCVREASSYARVYLESQVGRGLVDTSYTTGFVQVSSGNFVTARPYDIDGGDFGYAGTVEKINTERINHLLESNDVVLIGCLGYTETGEVYNCASEQVAMLAAAQLSAHKLCFLYDGHELRDRSTGGIVHSMPYTAGQAFLDDYRRDRSSERERREKEQDRWMVQTHEREAEEDEVRKENELLMYMELAVEACAQGVKRSHLIQRQEDGSLLLELFTRDGGGLMISRDLYDGVRPARPSDISSLLRLIGPLEEKGILVRRTKEAIEHAISSGEFTVVERDGTVIACASLTLYTDDQSGVIGWGEIGCIAVHPNSRNSGKGNALVGYLLRRANNLGCSNVFALTTRTAHWFIERGFYEGTLDDLPAAKRNVVDRKRNSRVYMMQLQGTRQLDELELLTASD